MNRYSEISPSAYSPMTFEEIAMVPLMKRKQHDDVLAKQELIRSGLAKVDPLKEHLEEALRLKQGIESQMDNTALELSKNGINNDMIGKTIALNRQYQDLVSPTGRIGQINAAKIAEAQTKKEFMDSPELKEYGLDAKQKAWDKHRSQYTGYDSENKNIKNINSLSGPKYEDMQKDFTDLASKLGEETKTYLKNSGAHFKEGPFGGLIMVSGDGKTINTNNDANLKSLADVMSAKYVSSNGSGYKSREFAGFDKQNIIDQLNGMMGIPRVDKTVKDMNYNYNFINDPNAGKEENEPTDLDAVNVEGVSITKNKDMYDILTGKKTPMEGNGQQGSIAGTFKYDTKKSISETIASPEYNKLAYSLTRNNPKLAGKKFNSPEVQAEVVKYLAENKDVTIQNKYVDPNVNKQAYLFANKELTGKEGKDKASNLIMERAQRGAYDVVDEDGKQIDKNTLGKYKFTYNGDMTAKSVTQTKDGKPLFKNAKQNIGARTGVLVDKDGNTKVVYISRSSDDFNTPQFKAMNTINSISRIVDTQPGIYHHLKNELFDAYGMKNVHIKYNKNKKTYNISYQNSDNEHVDSELSDEKFQQYILDDYNNLGN